MAKNVITITDADENEIALPATWAICGICRGNGKHSLRFGAITMQDRDENWSPEEWDDYMSGALDAACEPCKGEGKILVLDRDACTPEQIKLYDEDMEAEAAYLAECAAERAMGC